MFSNAANNSLPFSEADLRRALASAEGRQLLAILRSGSAEAVEQAQSAVRSGDFCAVREALEPLLRDPQAQALLKKLQAGQK